MADLIGVTWITRDGREMTADVPVGHTLMQAAVANDVPGIVGECGGALACATCHVVVEHAPFPLAPASRGEADMLDFAEAPPTAGSRLSCQITASRQLDGLVLRVP